MKKTDIFRAWSNILQGRRPFLSLEITKECPLRCPGCYAYEPQHLGGPIALRQLSDFRGDELVERALSLVRRLRPLHISIIGGEPLVRYRELDRLLPELMRLGVEVQLVTSAVRPIPEAWASLSNLHLVISIDGLQPEHDQRRSPATYERVLQHVAGHQITVHCTITRQLLARPGYLQEFCEFWSQRDECRTIWFSLFTPQQGDGSEERLTQEDRVRVVREIAAMAARFPKMKMPNSVLEGYLKPPRSPEECIFSRVTTCVSADLETTISPCQFGGQPECTECGCIASAGLFAIGNTRLAGLVKLGDIFAASRKIGQFWNPAPLKPAAPSGAELAAGGDAGSGCD